VGHLKGDGRATNVTAPAGVISFGELYRIDGWTGIALSRVEAADTKREIALEVSAERIWYVNVGAVAAAKGDILYWTAGAGFKAGATALQATAGVGPAVKIEEAKDGNNIAGVRVLQGAPV
jgi:hypothetical protein